MSETKATMVLSAFSLDDIRQFAEWSGDRNPLHVDPAFASRTYFGETVVHGMLASAAALSTAAVGTEPFAELEIEFRGAIRPGTPCHVSVDREAAGFAVSLAVGDTQALTIRARSTFGARNAAADLSWVAAVAQQATAARATPVERTIEEFRQPIEVSGVFETDVPPSICAPKAGLSALHVRVLGLCSYVVGMEIPGLRSLFMRAAIRFAADLRDAPSLVYRAVVTRFDEDFRILDTRLDIARPDGSLVATAELRSYARFSPAPVALDRLAEALAPATRLDGKVALVCGGARGLGESLTSGLALAGCHVYATSRAETAAGREMVERLTAHGAHLDVVHGDIGDPTWCAALVRDIRAHHGHLDVLVLNACSAPTAGNLSVQDIDDVARYMASNMRLVQVPLTTSLPALEEDGGAVVYVSSSFVQDPPAGFAAYVAVKQAAEALVRTAARERPTLACVIARPPRLQTSWNDTPTGVLGTISADRAAAAIVRSLSTAQHGHVEVVEDFPAFAPRPLPNAAAHQPVFTLAVSSSFTADPIVSGLSFLCESLGINGHVALAPYGQILQSLLDPSSALSTNARGTNVILLRVLDWLRELADDQTASPDSVRRYLEQTARDFDRAMRTHRAQAKTDTLLVLCPSGGTDDPHGPLVDDAERAVLVSASGLPGLHVVRAEAFHERYRVQPDQILDAVRDEIGHIPYTDAYFQVLASIVVRHAHRKLAARRKAVVVDCDNTLWRGVVGEVGAEGVAFDPPHVGLQRALAALSQNGVLICLCSKNEEPDVWRVFETRSDFGLRRDQVVAAMINWRPKSDNLRTLAGRLNLGLDSFVFLDDNPVECAEVRAACPEVLTLEWPQDPERAHRLLAHTWELDVVDGTAEDQRRTQLYQEEFKRQELRDGTLTFKNFIDSLNLIVDLAPLTATDLRRASQLTLRTNQFNFTTRRRDEVEVEALLASGAQEIRTVTVRDRFGDYGLVGLLIVGVQAGRMAVDTFLLSCRVLGRGVEHRMAADIGRMALARDIPSVTFTVEFTKRNTPARQFLEQIASAGTVTRTPTSLTCEMPSAALAELRFDPTENGDDAALADVDAGTTPSPASGDTERIRTRERQIARTAYELATPGELLAAVLGTAGGPAADAAAGVTVGDIAAFVYDAFANALHIPADTVKNVDRLDALGCDSMKIVEITVALVERFPALPRTLLFEHRSVAQIVEQISALQQPVQSASGPAIRTTAEADRRDALVSTDIAVVGMDVRCAGANSPSELWTLLRGHGTSVTPVPRDRRVFLRSLADTRPHWAGLMEDVDAFDPEFFGISPREAMLMDPQLRLFLQVAWGALEDAGCTGTGFDSSTGVFAGVMYGDYGYQANLASNAGDNPYRCWEGFSLANRLSQVLGFRGPSLAVDTACSSSGTALHLAVRALHDGDCRLAVVGGVNLILDPDRFISLGHLGILSATGRCLAFGAEADGTVLGEGAGAVVLRPLADAQQRGDRIHGIIKGTGLSTGSGSVGFTAPNPQAQAEAIRRSVQVARLDPRTITYVETHGTGTALGDPIEVRGLTLAYGDPALHDPEIVGTPRCTIGSIKPNIGHLEAGAGIVGLIKVLLQFQHGQRLPSITSTEPNPQIPFQDTPFDIQRSLERWDRPTMQVGGRAVSLPRRAGLSSFGVGGANAHVIVEEPPDVAAAPQEVDRPAHILTVSARSAAQLQAQCGRLATWLQANPSVSLPDVCYTATVARKHFEHRVAVPVVDGTHLAEVLRQLGEGQLAPGAARGVRARTAAPPRLAFLFTGQGSQWVGMGHQLYDTQPVFRDALDLCARLFDARLAKPLLSLLFAEPGSPDAGLLDQTGYTQPALFAFEYSLAVLWQSWGIVPDAVTGHSVGEFAALTVAGGVSLDDGMALVAARGRLMQALPAGGGMTSVMADERRVREAIAGREDVVAIAAINGPEHTVISGEASVLADIAARLSADGIKTKALTVSHAFHSPLMKPMVDEYLAVVRTVAFKEPQIPFVSCVEGRVLGAELADPTYWARQVLDPVRFTAAVAALDARETSIYVEVGPQPVLVGMARQSVAAGDRAWLASVRKDVDVWQTLLGTMAQLHVLGAPIDWKGFDGPYTRRLVSLPAYPFSAKPYWIPRAKMDRPSVVSVVTAPDAAPLTPPESAFQVYTLAWREVPTVASDACVTGQHWLLIGDEGGMANALARALTESGAHCEVLPAIATEQDVRQALGADGRPVHAVVYLRALDAREAVTLTSDALSLLCHQCLDDVVRIANVVAAGRVAPSTRVWVVTQSAVPAPDSPPDEPLALFQSPLWGLARSLAVELPEAWGGIVDIRPGTVQSSARGVLAHIAAREHDQAALRGARTYVPRLVPAPLVAGTDRVALDADGAYLVTGGTGALGLRVARWLASKGARHLVLASRRGATTPEASAAVAALGATGVTVHVERCDVSRPADVDALLARIAAGGHPLRGLVHAAGADIVVPLDRLGREDIDRVFAPKADAAWLLHDRTRHLPLDLFVCFSSMASLLGAGGRAHYGAANAFLDLLAYERRRLGLRALTVNWGPWSGGGMASDTQLAQFARMGNHALAPGAALGALESLVLDASRPAAGVANIDWARFRPVYEAKSPRPLLAELPVVPSAASTDTARDEGWHSRLRETSADGRVAALEDLIRTEVAGTFGFSSAADVPLDRSFFDLGMDSLTGAELASRLEHQVGVRCSSLVFDRPTVSALAARLVGEMAVAPVADAAPTAWLEAIEGASNGHRGEALRALLRREAAQVLGFARPEDVAGDRPFSEMGMDSLLAADFSGRLSATLGVGGANLVFQFPTIDALAAHLIGELVHASPDGVVSYTPTLDTEVLAFQKIAFPARRDDWVAPRWRWMFVDSATRLAVPPRVWLYRDHGKIVGQNGALPVKVKIGDEERLTAWLVDTMVLEPYRNQAVGTRLMMQAHEDLPFCLSLGQQERMRQIQFRLGWERVAPLQTAQLLIRPDRVLKGKMPAPAAAAAAWGLRARSAVRDALRSGTVSEARAIDAFDARHDRLWRRAAADLTCAVVRDASYLNWKYVDQPGQQFLRLETGDGQDVGGVAILMFQDPDEAYQYRRAFLVDLVAPLSDAGQLEQLVRSAAHAAASREADALICHHTDKRLTRALQASGFLVREPTRMLLVRPGPLQGEARSRVLSADAWYLTQGDSDIDRPW